MCSITKRVLQGPPDEYNKASITDKVSFGIEMLYNLLLYFINVIKLLCMFVIRIV